MKNNNIALFCQFFEIEGQSYTKYFGWKGNKIFYANYSKGERISFSKPCGFKFGLVVKTIKQK